MEKNMHKYALFTKGGQHQAWPEVFPLLCGKNIWNSLSEITRAMAGTFKDSSSEVFNLNLITHFFYITV